MSVFNGLRKKSIFVTGHTGFKGSWLCLWLSQFDANITGYALAPPTEPNNFEVSRARDVLQEHHLADIRDYARLKAAMQQAKPDVVLHLAAQSVVREGYRAPRETFDVNIMGTVNVLEAVRELANPCSVVCVTSDKCYENVEQVWGYRETDPMGDHDPYGGSKGAAEIAIQSYRHSFFPPAEIARHGIKLASGRAGNVIGGGDWTENALIVDVVKSLANKRPVALRNPSAFRPWQHVLQALSGYLTLAAKLVGSDDPKYCGGWNFGPVPGNEIPVSELVDVFLREWGSGTWEDASNGTDPRESNILRLSIDKAIWELGWKPGWHVGEVLQKTAYWYQRHAQGECMRDFSLQQIAEYEASFCALSKAPGIKRVDNRTETQA
ncbi:MAG: CDP-glucose 4,6-dehydratase [Pirellulaceae bacterium]|nr:CDP-glucose 4,6-dehydratase [Pirellulaceae bacterium]